ncbi:hypothetical protein T440DRAFT_96993 [Plenodomus tracheiphilus IPT5]|uniref:Uncharacterized protein n=1 Tax=Plenodomus tracheiphilus IPT5 TaxID=1408161 RepID=A0A6A7BPD7_9PLEO|nr:hypothetical protein T440DRAFT_96993 [Plenodomus tracheiphilus IPT5]
MFFLRLEMVGSLGAACLSIYIVSMGMQHQRSQWGTPHQSLRQLDFSRTHAHRVVTSKDSLISRPSIAALGMSDDYDSYHSAVLRRWVMPIDRCGTQHTTQVGASS